MSASFGDSHDLEPSSLNDRKQFANVNSKDSSVNIVFGVPQSSLLGPRLFRSCK